MLFLLDASAVLNDLHFSFSPKHRYLATPLVYREWRALEPRLLAEHARQRGLLSLREPSSEALEQVRKKVAEEGFTRLSEPDRSVLALALDLKRAGEKFQVLTDDYSIQNFLSLFGIPFHGVLQEEIKETISFQAVCTGCKRTFAAGQAPVCPECGAQLRVRRKRTNAGNGNGEKN